MSKLVDRRDSHPMVQATLASAYERPETPTLYLFELKVLDSTLKLIYYYKAIAPDIKQADTAMWTALNAQTEFDNPTQGQRDHFPGFGTAQEKTQSRVRPAKDGLADCETVWY
jgi:hypothetical protein